MPPNMYICRHCEYFAGKCTLEKCAYPNLFAAQEKRFPSSDAHEIEIAYKKHVIGCAFPRCKQAAQQGRAPDAAIASANPK